MFKLLVGVAVVASAMTAVYACRPCGEVCTDSFWSKGPTKQQVERELSWWVNVNKSSGGATGLYPLHLAIKHRSSFGVDALLKAGADPNVQSAHISSPLHLAAQLGTLSDVRSLLGAGADPRSRSKTGRGRTPLEIASKHASPEVLKALVDAGAEVDENNSVTPPLLEAANGRKVENVRYLIAAGANVQGTCPTGDPLSAAARKGPIESVKLLLVSGANPEGCNGGTPPIHRAALSRDPAIIAAVIESGAKINSTDANGNNALHGAAEYGNIEGLVQLLKAGADPNVRNRLGISPLHRAADSDSSVRAPQIKALIDAGADVNSVDDHLRAPIHVAVNGPEFRFDEAGPTREASLRALVAGDATIDLRDENGATAFLLAARFGTPEMLRILIDAGADRTARGQQGRTALHYAASASRSGALEFVLELGGAVSAVDDQGATPLHLAAANESPENARMLLYAGASVLAVDKFGATPLHYAARYSGPDTVLLLLGAGADPKTEDDEGNRASDFASGNGRLKGRPTHRLLQGRP